jgi:site-specific recombinase XerC
MDRWGWQQMAPWLDYRVTLPVGTLLCIIAGLTAGRPWSAAAARTTLRSLAVDAGVRRRVAPHQLRHAHAVETGAGGRAAECHPTPARTWERVIDSTRASSS